MRSLRSCWPTLAVFLLVVFFFYRLFFPPSIFVTPDFGLSDTLNQNFAFRVFLHESLKQGKLPWWDSKIGMGFPLLAEGQLGALNLFNLILAFLFSPWFSFNLTYLIVFLMVSIFTYFYVLEIGLGRLAALFASVVVMFSGPMVGHLIHINLLLTFAYFPLEMWLVEKALQKTENREQKADTQTWKAEVRLVWWLLLALVINQQILAGHMQMAVYSLIVLTAYFLWRVFVYQAGNSRIRVTPALFSFGAALLTGVILSLPQLLPSLELAKQSGRASSLPMQELTRFPFLPKNLLGFLNPDWAGNPKLGGYGKGGLGWGLWWENTGYIGILPLGLAMISIGYLTIKLLQLPNVLRSKFEIQNSKFEQPTQYLVFFTLLSLLGILLAFGLNGPLGFLYKLPPLSLFRVPARWVFFVSFSLAVLAGFGLQKVSRQLNFGKALNFKLSFAHPTRNSVLVQGMLYTLTFVLVISDLWFYFYRHNPVGKIDKWLSPPATVEFIKSYDPNYQDYRVYSLGATVLWDRYFWQEGWQGQRLERFKNLRQGLTPNLTAIWGLSSADVYAGVKPLGLSKAQFLLGQHQVFKPHPEDVYRVSFDDLGVRILSSQNVKYIITPLVYKGQSLVKVYEKDLQEFTIRIYENKTVWPRFYFVENIQTNFSAPVSNEELRVQVVKDDDQDVVVKVRAPQDVFLVWSQNYYPNWKAFVDGQAVKIYQYNLNQMAVFLQAGPHTIKFEYEPFSF